MRRSPAMLRLALATSSLLSISFGTYCCRRSGDDPASVVGTGAGGAADAGTGTGAPTGWPQLEQNLAPGSSLKPQLRQFAVSDVPQLEQNFASSRFSVPQLGQFMLQPP
jgi:hypothetical protein